LRKAWTFRAILPECCQDGIYQSQIEGEEKMSDWKSELANSFSKKEQINKVNEEKIKAIQGEVAKYYSEVVVPAFEELKAELEKYQRKVKVSSGIDFATIEVKNKRELELIYSLKVRILPDGAIPYSETRFRDKSKNKSYRAEGKLRYGSKDYDLSQITKDEIIEHFLSHYKRQINLP
jgi:hypothetical protein